MNIFYRPMYYSETTEFLGQFKAKHPEVSATQTQNRALMWEKAVDSATSSEFQAARVVQKPYVYQTNLD